MKNVVLIGAKGMVGQDFYNRYSKKYNITRFDKENIEDFEKTISNKNYDYLIFLAQSPEYKIYPYTRGLIDVNVNLLRFIIENSINRIKNIIYFSTGSVYNSVDDHVTEISALNFFNPSPYIASKLSGELTLQSMKKSFESIIILRPFFIYGPSQNENMLIPSLINKVVHNIIISLNQGEGIIVNPTFVADVSVYLSYIIENNIESHIQNIFGPEIISLRDICEKIGILSNNIPKYQKTEHPISRIVSKTVNNYYRPNTSLMEGLKIILNSR